MNPERWDKIKEIFSQAADLPPADREFFLSSYPNSEAAIIDEVRRLLAADENPRFEKPIAIVSPLWNERETQKDAGKQIGSYRIIREIGRGGMGIVYEAVREIDDVAQKVALKILQPGVASGTLLSRFRRERQILAALEHPHIARLLDGGSDADGTPFLSMEFVDGIPIDEFCDQKNLSVPERLRLFLQICAAVSFAHSRLVVHRDLKPPNILVTKDGAVKLLDFGISKILSDEQSLLGQTVTRFGMMTPAYASPEQIKGEQLTTASDIYSLGLILYELLTGAKAYAFPSDRADEMAKIICASEPVRPSSVVLGSARNTKSSTAKNGAPRTSDKASMTNPKSLRGDLDNIVLKALRKETSRRYVSVEQFAGDIRRHLNGLPVIARPATFFYRVEKFITRNRLSVIAGMLIFLVLAGGIAATSWQAYRAEQQRQIAERQKRNAEQRFRQVRELANNIVFKYYDEAQKLPNSTVMRQMFVDDSLAYFNSLAEDASADDGLKSELARTFLRIGAVQGRPSSPNLGNTSGALENYRKGIELLEFLAESSGDTRLQGDLIAAYTDYAVILRQSGNKAESAEIFQKANALAEKYAQSSPNDETLFLKIVVLYLFYGEILPIGAAEGENIPVFSKVIELSENFLESQPGDLRASNYLAAGCERKGDQFLILARSARERGEYEAAKRYLAEAQKLYKRYLAISENLTRTHPGNVISPALYASANASQAAYLIETAEFDKALSNLQKSLDFYGALLEKDDAHVGLKTYVADIEGKFGIIYYRTSKTKKAESKFARAERLIDKAVQTDPNNFDFAKQRAQIKFSRADELLRLKNVKQARRHYTQAYFELREIAKVKDPEYARSLEATFSEKLGDCLAAESDGRKATFEYEKALAIWQKTPALNIYGNIEKDKAFLIEKKLNNAKINST